jgi:tetratricopeptide (TPR) repeat protein
LDEIAAIVERLKGREKAPGLLYLGSGYLAVEKSIQASKHFEDAFAIYKESQDVANQRATLERISQEYLARSMVDDGINILNRLLQSYKGSGLGEAKTHMSLAAAYVKQNKVEKAVENYKRASSLYEEQKYFPGQVGALYEIGKLRYDASRFDEAIPVLENARNVYKKYPYLRSGGEVLMLLAQAYGANKQSQKALSLYEEAANAYNANSQRKDESKALIAISQIYEAQGDFKNAQLYKDKAEQAAKPIPGIAPQSGPPGP